MPAVGQDVLVAGGSGGGKSRLATRFGKRLSEGGFQTRVVEPEGEYQASQHAIVVGNPFDGELEELCR